MPANTGGCMKKLISIAIAAGLSACLFAELNLKTLVNPKYYDELVSKGEVTVIHDDEPDTSVLFPNDETKKIFDGSRIKKDPKGYSYFYESLYYKSKAELTGGKGTVTLEDIAKVVRSVSKMQGMTYTDKNGKEKVLYDKAFMIASPDNKNPIADKNTGNANNQVSYSLQNDTKFGLCRYKINYYQTENTFYAVLNNIDDYKSLGVVGIPSQNLNFTVVAYDCGDGILVYLSSDANCRVVPTIKTQVPEAMTQRIKAIYNWFIKQF